MLERTRARRQALQILYQREITEQTVAQIIEGHSYSEEDGEPSDYCRALALGTEVNCAVIDGEIEATSQHWSLMRMPYVDRNILRLAVYEILFEPDVPDSVAINEAVEMAKAYGTDDSPKFVNGVLGRIAELHGAAIDPVVLTDVTADADAGLVEASEDALGAEGV